MRATLNDVINLSIDNRLSNVHTALPATVEKYDAATQLANVKPNIMRKYNDGSLDDLPIVVNCPVVFPSGGGGLLSFPVKKGKKGDKCLLLLCEQSLDVWISKGGNVDPLDKRRFDLSDGIALMGMFSVPDAGLADPDSVVLQDINGSKIKLNPDKSIEIISGNGEKFILSGDGAIVLESAGGAKLSLNADGKLALGNSVDEILTILDDILSELQITLTATSIGSQPFINAANYGVIQSRLAQVKGVL